MKLLVPIPVTSLITNVPEDDYPEYTPAETGYALEDKVMVSSEHNIYESLKNGNTSAPTGKTDENWALVGKTNAHKSTDDKVGTQTVYLGDITYKFPTLRSTSIAFLNMQCNAITVEILNGEEVIYSETQKGKTRSTKGWYSYFFEHFKYKKFFLFRHIYNPYATYRITIHGTVCKVGGMIPGRLYSLGDTQWAPSATPKDYSKYDIDRWGETYLKEGKHRLVAKGTVAIKTSELAYVLDLFVSRMGKLSLYIPTQVLNFPFVYGYVREPELVWQNPVKSFYTLDIQGVI